MKIAIIGFGREGQSAYRWLKRRPEYKTAEWWALDQNPALILPRSRGAISPLRAQLGPAYLENCNRFDMIVRSPGVPYTLVAKQLGKSETKPANSYTHSTHQPSITSATKLFFDHCPCPIIGITGTKGKGTTATLIYNILKACGRDAYLAGNIGKSPLDILSQLNATSLAVLELSSFQLQDLNRSPHYAAVLDIFPDHLDAHKNFKEYLVSKAHIAWNQKPGDAVFYFADNENSSWIAHQSKGKRISIYHAIDHATRERLRAHMRIPGAHNWRNAQTAFVVARALGCQKSKLFKAIAAFHGNEHRLEMVRDLILAHGGSVEFYNDSASTNPQTTIAAVRAFSAPKILIAGGKDKNLDYTAWNAGFARQRIKHIFIYGADREKIKNSLRGALMQKATMVADVKEAVRAARTLAQRNDVVLFSPGAASFDMFKNYAERGAAFKRIVKMLT